MTTYTVEPGNIAAVCYVRAGDARQQTFIYMAPNRLPVTTPREDDAEFRALPAAVQDAVNAHFAAVFALPVEQRGAYLETVPTVEITAEEPSLYRRLVAAGATLDSHESDLYVRADPAAVAIVSQWAKERGGAGISYFRSEIDGRQWIDVPFMFDPFWQNKQR